MGSEGLGKSVWILWMVEDPWFDTLYWGFGGIRDFKREGSVI